MQTQATGGLFCFSEQLFKDVVLVPCQKASWWQMDTRILFGRRKGTAERKSVVEHLTFCKV